MGDIIFIGIVGNRYGLWLEINAEALHQKKKIISHSRKLWYFSSIQRVGMVVVCR